MSNLNTTLQYINSLGHSGIKLGLGPMQTLLKSLGNPQNNYPTLHVAGTNGKGSVAAMMASILKQAGLQVGLYTSPHLVRLNERFNINGIDISNSHLVQMAQEIRNQMEKMDFEGGAVTQFEFLTGMAFEWFFREKIDIAVIETGLGGRLDATNLMDNVLVSIITNIDLEHTQWLGNSIREIAGEKSGIIKKGIPVVTGASGEALNIIRQRAIESDSPITMPSSHEPPEWQKIKENVPLKGEHQYENAKLAVGGIELISHKFGISPQHIIDGLRKTRWPGRFEKINVLGKLGENTLILDAAHNPAAAKVLSQTLISEKIEGVELIIGMLKDKNVSEFVTHIKPLVKSVHAVPLPSSRSLEPGVILESFSGDIPKMKYASIESCWDNLLSNQRNGPILVTGSLYLIGEIKKILELKTSQDSIKQLLSV